MTDLPVQMEELLHKFEEVSDRLAAVEQEMAKGRGRGRTEPAASPGPARDLRNLLRARLAERPRGKQDRDGLIASVGVCSLGKQAWEWETVRGLSEALGCPDYEVSRWAAALANEARVGILKALLHGPRTVTQIAEQLHLSVASQAQHHLRELELAGFLLTKGEGAYELRPDRVPYLLTMLALSASAGKEPDAGH